MMMWRREEMRERGEVGCKLPTSLSTEPKIYVRDK
jgi:hypothetical protein